MSTTGHVTWHDSFRKVVALFGPTTELLRVVKARRTSAGLLEDFCNHTFRALYEFLRNDTFDARNFFALSKAPLKQNQFGVRREYRIPPSHPGDCNIHRRPANARA